MNDLGKAELNLAAQADALKNQLGQPAGDPAAAQAAQAALNQAAQQLQQAKANSTRPSPANPPPPNRRSRISPPPRKMPPRPWQKRFPGRHQRDPAGDAQMNQAQGQASKASPAPPASTAAAQAALAKRKPRSQPRTARRK